MKWVTNSPRGVRSFADVLKRDDRQQIGVKEFHEQLWRCRDFELQHLWQRSVFLTAFLVLCFTAYGVLLFKLLDAEGFDFPANSLAMLLCTVGGIFSVMWIMMAKASKAWYERYEQAIDAFCEEDRFIEPVIKDCCGFKYENMQNYNPPAVDSRLWSTKGGGYSPSAINVAIGQVAVVIWIVLWSIHAVTGFFCEATAGCSWLLPAFPVALSLFFCGLFGFFVCRRWMRSGMIKETEE